MDMSCCFSLLHYVHFSFSVCIPETHICLSTVSITRHALCVYCMCLCTCTFIYICNAIFLHFHSLLCIFYVFKLHKNSKYKISEKNMNNLMTLITNMNSI